MRLMSRFCLSDRVKRVLSAAEMLATTICLVTLALLAVYWIWDMFVGSQHSFDEFAASLTLYESVHQEQYNIINILCLTCLVSFLAKSRHPLYLYP